MRTAAREKNFQEQNEELSRIVSKFRRYQSEQFYNNLTAFRKKLNELHAEFSDHSINPYQGVAIVLANINKIQLVLIALIIEIKKTDSKELLTLLQDKEKAHNFSSFLNEIDSRLVAITEKNSKLRVIREGQRAKHLDVIPDTSPLLNYIQGCASRLNELVGLLETLQCPSLYATNPEVVSCFNDTREHCKSLLGITVGMFASIKQVIIDTVEIAQDYSKFQMEIDGGNAEELVSITSAQQTVDTLIAKVEMLKKLANDISESKANQATQPTDRKRLPAAPTSAPMQDRMRMFSATPQTDSQNKPERKTPPPIPPKPANLQPTPASIPPKTNASVVDSGKFSVTHKEVKKAEVKKAKEVKLSKKEIKALKEEQKQAQKEAAKNYFK